MVDKLKVIIPASGPGRRMKSYGPKALIKLDNTSTVLSRQLRIIQDKFPEADIIVVVGFEAEKICKELPKGVGVVYNEFYEETNVAHSLMLGLSTAKSERVLIVYGDLVFNAYTLPANFDKSTAIINSNNQMGKTEVGVTVVDKEVTRFSYGLPIKWAQIVYLTGLELALFKNIICNKNKAKFFGFEILNHMLDKGGSLEAVEPYNMRIAEIDTSKDIEIAKQIPL